MSYNYDDIDRHGGNWQNPDGEQSPEKDEDGDYKKPVIVTVTVTTIPKDKTQTPKVITFERKLRDLDIFRALLCANHIHEMVPVLVSDGETTYRVNAKRTIASLVRMKKPRKEVDPKS